MTRFTTKNNPRNKIGSQIAELPPALILLFLVILFPVLDMLYIFLAYCGGWYLNQIEMRQVAYLPPLGASGTFTPPTVNLSESQSWHGLLGVTESPDSPAVTYIPLPNSTNQVGKAQVTTTININPFLTQTSTWVPQVPGLNQPITFTYTNTILQEDQTPQPPTQQTP